MPAIAEACQKRRLQGSCQPISRTLNATITTAITTASSVVARPLG
ncbi:MAG: hypothetical protein ACYCUM_03065 [Solirubrobacteraceae bacterium]